MAQVAMGGAERDGVQWKDKGEGQKEYISFVAFSDKNARMSAGQFSQG